jgi:hypothetical protein
MNDRQLDFAVFSVIFSVLVFGIWSNIEVYAQQSSSNSSVASASPQQHVSKIKITSPTKGQQVPVGKDLPIYGTSIGSNGTSNNNNDCKVSVIVNNVKPYQQANPGGTTTANYSKWNFVLSSKYTTIKPGQNKITAKYECASNPASKSFSSVNVTGIQGTSVVAASATRGAASVADSPKIQQVAITDTTTTTTHNPSSDSTGRITWATIASISKPDNTSSLLSSLPPSRPTPIAPQVTAISQQQQPLIAGIKMTQVNSTSAQNYTFAAISPVPASGKLMYLGYHGDTGGDSSSSMGHSTSDSSGSDHKSSSSDSRSSDSKSSSNTIRISDSASTEKKKSSDSGNSKSIRADFTNADSNSKAKSSHNTDSSASHSKSSTKDSTDNTDSSSNTKSSSPTNHNSGSSSDLATAINNKVDSIIKNRIRGISDNTPFVLPFH